MSLSLIYGSCSYASTGKHPYSVVQCRWRSLLITATTEKSVRILNKKKKNPSINLCFCTKKYVACRPPTAPHPFPSLCQQLDWLSHPLHHHTKQTIAPSKRLKSRMRDSTRLLKWVLLSPWGFPHQPQHKRSSQLLYVCCLLEVDIDLVADTEKHRRSFFFFPPRTGVPLFPVGLWISVAANATLYQIS